jgi:hypothetical protein
MIVNNLISSTILIVKKMIVPRIITLLASESKLRAKELRFGAA